MSKRIPGLTLTNPVHLLAFGFGSGVIPKAPGTWGTLVAIPIYVLLQELAVIAYLVVVVAMSLLGIWLCGRAAKDLGVHDHPGIVWDEIVGYLITMIAAPSGWLWWLIGFALFRIFDIIKPWPIGPLDKNVEGGLGIMLDDIVAGVMAMVCVQLLAYTFA